MAETYKYRAELQSTVETVHRKNAILALGSRGISLAGDTSWQTICELSDQAEGEHRLTHITYMGRVPVGQIFGKDNWKLNYSKPTPQGKILAREAGNLELMHNHLRIHLSHDSGFAEVMIIPDTPPVAVDERAIGHVLWHAEHPVDIVNDGIILRAIQDLDEMNGEKAWEYVDEATAKSLVFAVQNDTSFAQYA
jgi:hypothetical protein